MDNKQVKQTVLRMDSLGKTEQQTAIKDWLSHPVTELVYRKLRADAIQAKGVILYGETPSLFDPTFMLREQLIGEVRGLERVEDIVNLKLKELTDEEKQAGGEQTEQTTEIDS